MLNANRLSMQLLCAAVVSACLALPATGRAADHFLTIGGGSTADNNQISLEKNVLYLQKCLSDCGLGALPHEIIFTDGDAGARDLVYVDPGFRVPRVNQLLADVLGRGDGMDEQYRAHAIPNLWGPSGRKGIKKWFDTVGGKLSDGDRLFIYFTGHGGPGRNNQGRRPARGGGGGGGPGGGQPNAGPPTDQTLAMWNEPDMTVREFNTLLDGLPKGVSVVLIMVQCFGGGFADVIYDGAAADKGLSAANRCGFFATVPTRPAAGCTAQVKEEGYREYSTYFWAALFGKTRTGKKVPPPDYDGDGKVSLAEAHAYTAIHSDTIDIPMKTSDAFLRKYSKTTGANDLLAADADYDDLLAAAGKPDAAVLEGLSADLKLGGARRVADAKAGLGRVEQQRKDVEQQKEKVRNRYFELRNSLWARLKAKWPELNNPLHPLAAKIVAEQGDQVVKWVEAAPEYKEFDAKGHEIERLDDQSGDLEVKWVKHQRFLRTAENVALGANLSKVAKADVVERFGRLVELENGVLPAGPSDGPPAAAETAR